MLPISAFRAGLMSYASAYRCISSVSRASFSSEAVPVVFDRERKRQQKVRTHGPNGLSPLRLAIFFFLSPYQC
jgi:hypothetical protein